MTRIGFVFPLSSIVAFAFGLGACSSAPPQGFGGGELDGARGVSQPIVGGTPAGAYPEAALVDMYKGGQLTAYCSGSVIAPQVVLTAGHCVDGFDGWRVTAPYASGGSQSANSSSGTTYDWNEHGSETVNPNHHDIGLVFLSSAIDTTYPALANSQIPDGSKVVNVGRIQDGSLSTTDLFKGSAVTVSDATSSGFPFDYVSNDIIQSGDSGGPDFLPGSAPHTIVSVNSGAGSGTQVLARVDLLSSWIQQQIAAHGGGGGSGGGSGGGGGGGGNGGGACDSNEQEPNDAYTSPNALAAGTLCGEINPGSDKDWFTWSVASAGVAYDVKLVATGDAQIQMWKNSGGKYYRVSNTSATEIAHTSGGAGSYVLAVWSPGGATQSYTLTLTR